MRGLNKEMRTIVFDPNRAWTEQAPEVLPRIDDGAPEMIPTSWSPDGSRIAYLADQTTDTFIHLYVSDANGSRNTPITTALLAT